MVMFYTLSLCMLLLANQHALALNCNATVNPNGAPSGFFSGPPSGLEPNIACNLTVLLPAGNSSINVQLSMISIAPGDKLVVYDGIQNLLADFTAKSVIHKVLVGFQSKLIFSFTPLAKTSKSTWSVKFDTEECAVSIQNSWITILDSPIFLKTNVGHELKCVYTVTSFLPLEYIAAAAFTGFSLSGNSSLKIDGAQGSPSYTSGSPQNDFFANGTDQLVLTLEIADTTSVQDFSLILEPVLRKCSGQAVVDGSVDVAAKFPTPVQAGTCRWLVSAEQRPLLHATVSSLRLATVGGGDSLAFRSGGSSRGAVLDALVNDVDDYLVVTASNTMLMTLTMGSSQGQRGLNITFMDAESGGYMKESGFLTAGESTDNEEIYFSLEASQGQWVDVTSMTNLTNGSSVNFYDGAQPSSPLLTIWSDGDQDLSPVTGHERMLVVVSNLSADEFFNASFTSVPAGCDTLTSAASGSRTFSASSSLQKNQTCTWTVAPMQTLGTVVISISSLNLREAESLTVTSGMDSAGQVLAQFAGPRTLNESPLPQVYIPSAQTFRVSYTRLATGSPFCGAVVQYSTLPQACGGQLSAPTGVIQTPNYPNQYPVNAYCAWSSSASEEMTASPSPLLLLSFSSLSLAQDHSISVLQHQENKSQPVSVAKYGGISPSPSTLPDDLILPGASNLTVAFSSQPSSAEPAPSSVDQVAGGASLNYWILECGGNLTAADGSFTSPEFSKPPTKSALCVWILNVAEVKGPEKSTNILSFNIQAVGKDAKSIGQYLKIYDGPSMRSQNYPLTQKATNLSRYDSIVVIFNLPIDAKSKPDVRLNFTYNTINCNTSQQCANGICMHKDWICNGHDDCGDDSDEQNCVIPPPSPAPGTPQSYSGWVKSGWVPGCLIIGILLGAGVAFFGPRVYHRLRRSSGSYNRMEEPVV